MLLRLFIFHLCSEIVPNVALQDLPLRATPDEGGAFEAAHSVWIKEIPKPDYGDYERS